MKPWSSIEFDGRSMTGSLFLQIGQKASCGIVVKVTRRAILNVASPPRATEERFAQHVEFFKTIALEKFHRVASCGRIDVTAEDVRVWRSRYGPPLPTDGQRSGRISPVPRISSS
jgi:hypothetical protein